MPFSQACISITFKERIYPRAVAASPEGFRWRLIGISRPVITIRTHPLHAQSRVREYVHANHRVGVDGDVEVSRVRSRRKHESTCRPGTRHPR